MRMPKTFAVLCALAPLLFAAAPPAFAGAADGLTGTWAVDIEASLDLPGINRREIYSPEQIARGKAAIETIRIVVDMEKKILLLQSEGKITRRGAIAGVKKKGGTITLLLGENGKDEQDVTLLPDGRLLAGPPANVVLRRMAPTGKTGK